jgi:hypothetical protein
VMHHTTPVMGSGGGSSGIKHCSCWQSESWAHPSPASQGGQLGPPQSCTTAPAAAAAAGGSGTAVWAWCGVCMHGVHPGLTGGAQPPLQANSSPVTQ